MSRTLLICIGTLFLASLFGGQSEDGCGIYLPPPPPPAEGEGEGEGEGERLCELDDGQVLAPGDSFERGCEICRCRTDGALVCEERPDCGGANCIFEGREIEDGDRFEAPDGCNECQCENGQVFCTEIACGGEQCFLDDGRVFQDGESFEADDGCNTCFCEGGDVFCTEIACGGECVTASGEVLGNGQAFFDGCNECFCEDGQLACTDRACNDFCNFEGDIAIPVGGTIETECGECICEPNGELICFERDECGGGCEDGNDPYNPDCGACVLDDGRVVQNGETFEDGCNLCTCEDGDVFCTEQACPCEYPGDPNCGQFCELPTGEILRPGESVFDGCNECTCLPGGDLACTDRACCDDPNDPDCNEVCVLDNGEVIPVGETVFDGCNECTCLEGGQLACTDRACPDNCFETGCPDGQVCIEDPLCDVADPNDECPGICVDDGGCQANFNIRESLYESNENVLASFTMGEVTSRIALNSGLTGGPVALRQMMSSFETQAGALFPNDPHCDDEGGPTLNGFPIECPRIEAQHNGIPNDIDNWFAISAVNRLDLTPTDGSTCGEARMIFANNSINRSFFIFEAVVPNPNPGAGVQGCLPVAEFWRDLSGQPVAARAQALEDAFILGHAGLQAAGVGPFFNMEAFTSGSGQVRSNSFDQGPWTLREFKLLGDAGELRAERAPTAGHIFSRFFDDAFLNGHPLESVCRQAILEGVEGVIGNNINTMAFDIPAECLAGESENDFSTNYEQQLNPGGQLAGEIQGQLTALGSSLTPNDVAVRMNFSQNCMACHVQGNNNLGGGLVISNPPGFVHTSEFGREACGAGGPQDCFPISQLLKNDFLPHRANVLADLLCGEQAGAPEGDASESNESSRRTIGGRPVNGH